MRYDKSEHYITGLMNKDVKYIKDPDEKEYFVPQKKGFSVFWAWKPLHWPMFWPKIELWLAEQIYGKDVIVADSGPYSYEAPKKSLWFHIGAEGSKNLYKIRFCFVLLFALLFLAYVLGWVLVLKR